MLIKRRENKPLPIRDLKNALAGDLAKVVVTFIALLFLMWSLGILVGV
jgi:hypothetical protein